MENFATFTWISFSTYSFIACSFDIPLILSHASLHDDQDQILSLCEIDRHHLYRSRSANTVGLAVFTSPTVAVSKRKLIEGRQARWYYLVCSGHRTGVAHQA